MSCDMFDLMSKQALDHATEHAAHAFLKRVMQHFDVTGAILYGSRARGNHRPDSDADVAVLIRGPHKRLLPTKLEMSDIAYDVLLDTGINISPLPVWQDEWEHPDTYSNPELLNNIAREGIRL